MQTTPLLIRSMPPHELDIALNWAAAEGWNPGLHDAASFYAADPEGFLLGLIGGEPVASIFAVRYGADFGFIGGYIVRPEFRGQGHGLAIWQAGMARLAGRNVGLDGVLAQQANYARSGFQLLHRNVRYEGRGTGRPATNGLVPLAALRFEEIERYDRRCFPEQRSVFLRHWISQSGHVALGVLAPHGLAGYGVLRPCRSGYKIGPLFADSAELAQQLFAGLVGRVSPDTPVFLDVPEPNAAATELARRHGMRPCFETARMYTQGQPMIDMARQFGITTFELG